MRRELTIVSIAGLLIAGLGIFVGWRFGQISAAKWQAAANAAIARDSLAQARSDSLRQASDSIRLVLGQLADRAAESDARVAVSRRIADSLAHEVRYVRDSVVAQGDSTVRVEVLDQALAVVDSQWIVIAEQSASIRVRDEQLLAAGALRQTVEDDRDLWRARSQELAQVLRAYEPPRKDRLLGIIPAPSATVTLFLGAVVGAVAFR